MSYVKLPGCNSVRRRSAWAEPEVVFRITHVSLANGESCGDYREQTVEIALGPKGAFQSGNVGVLTRRVPLGQVVNAVPLPRWKGRPPTPTKPAKTPRIVETLRKAVEWRRQLDAGDVPNQAAIARREGVTRARVTQIMSLLRLAPEIQKHIMAMPATVRRATITERALRPVSRMEDSEAQKEELDGLWPFVGHGARPPLLMR